MATETETYDLPTPADGTEDGTWGALWRQAMESLDDLLDGSSQLVSLRFKDAVMSGDALDPDGGNIQSKTLTANTSLTDSLNSGDWLILHLTRGSYTVSWPSLTWVPGDIEPTLGAGEEVLTFYKVGSTLYGSYVGSTS